MAKFYAYEAVSLYWVDFQFYDRNWDGWHLDEDVNQSWNGVNYADFYYAYAVNPETGDDWALGAAGNITINDTFLPEGTANAVAEWVDRGDGWAMAWLLEGVTVAMTDVIDALISPIPFDDIALLASELAGNDRIELSSADDVFSGFGGADVLRGNDGNDGLYGGAGPDTIFGGRGNDDAVGDQGNDRLNGDSGDDWIMGGSGDDVIQGGTGADFMNGQYGSDTYLYKRANDSTGKSVDTIGFFDHGEDVINLSKVDANENLFGNQTFVFAGETADDGTAAMLRFQTGDFDGGGVADDVLVSGYTDASGSAIQIYVYGAETMAAADFNL